MNDNLQSRNSPAAATDKLHQNDKGDWLHRLNRTAQNCIVIDIETTGLEPRTERIVEIAAKRVIDGHIVDSFHTLVNPDRPIPVFITDLTGISDGLVAGAPPFRAVADELYRFLTTPYKEDQVGLSPLVGHNVSFDFAFLQHEFVRHSLGEENTDGTESTAAIPPYTPELVCTAEASRALIDRERVGRYRLDKVAALLDTRRRPHHRAESDAEATVDVLLALTELTIT